MGKSAVLEVNAMGFGREKLHVLVVALLVAVMSLTACGRRGNLEAPPSASVIVADDNGDLVEEPASTQQDKPFILDPLL